MNELQAKFAQRAAASPTRTKRYRHVWTQEQNGVVYGDGVNTWAAIYELSTSILSTALNVRVLISAVDGGGGLTGEVLTRWSGAIKRVWSDKATVTVRETVGAQTVSHTRRVLFEVGWNDANAVYQVACKPTPGMAGLIASIDTLADADDRSDRLVSLGVPGVKAATYRVDWPRWRKESMLRDVDRDNVFHGTPNMLEWGAEDSEAVPHEFGHTIGLPDEYNVTKYNGNAMPAAIYAPDGFTTRSIMNNTVSSRGSTLYPRHFQLIGDDFLDLMRTLVKPAGVFQDGVTVAIL